VRVEDFPWAGAGPTAKAIRLWTSEAAYPPAVGVIEEEVATDGDAGVLRLTSRFDATEAPPSSLLVDPAEVEAALGKIDSELREAMEVASANIRAVAELQVDSEPRSIVLPQGQTVDVREVPVAAAGVYAPGGRAAYLSSVLMCAIPARVAGVERVALASPPGPDGHLAPAVLAAAALAGVDDVYAMGGAQAVFALAYGTESVDRVDVIVGPGNAWVQEAKRVVSGLVGIDSYAGPSELMLIAGHDTNPEWAALDLCAQAEHGVDSLLVAVAVEEHVLEALVAAAERLAHDRPSVTDAPMALVQVPDLSDAAELANFFAPEHLQLFEGDAALLAERIETAGCVFVGPGAATAFGDYVAGSNHVLPTGGTGRFSGPLGPSTFRRRIANVSIPGAAAAALAPYADALARAEGFPVHGESAMIRR
jgi:histidinol dehydrogenase